MKKYSLANVNIENKMEIIEYVRNVLKKHLYHNDADKYTTLALNLENIKDIIKLSLTYLDLVNKDND